MDDKTYSMGGIGFLAILFILIFALVGRGGFGNWGNGFGGWGGFPMWGNDSVHASLRRNVCRSAYTGTAATA